jgi:predicted dehydrogenase
MNRFLVIGPGLIGKKHIELIMKHPKSVMSAIVALHPQEHHNYTSQFGIPVYGDLDTAFQNHSFDAVVICTPNELHLEQALYCIDKGIPCLVEKPLADTLERARLISTAANNKGVQVLVGHHRTYSAYMPVAEKLIQDERFGKLVSIQGSAQFYKPKQYFLEGPWRSKNGGGPILINLIHEIGIMRTLCGEISKVFAFSSSATRGFEVEDTVSISLQFANSCIGSFILSDCAASSKSWEMTSGENSAYPHFAQESCYHICGTNGSLDFPNMNFRYYSNEESASWWSNFSSELLQINDKDPLYYQLDHFIKVVEGKEKAKVSAQSGYSNMLVLDAIQRSIRSEKPISLITDGVRCVA